MIALPALRIKPLEGVKTMTTLRNTHRVTAVEIDVTESTVILFNNQQHQPLSTTDIADIENTLGFSYPHLLDANTCTVVVIDDNQEQPYPLAG